MPSYALTFGVLLIGLGLYGYLGATSPQPTDSATKPAAEKTSENSDNTAEKPKASGTALIPAAIGMLLVICGTLGLQSGWRKHAMHAAATVALLGALACIVRLGMKLPAWLSGDEGVNSRAMIFLILMGILCLAYVGISIRSFIAARKARELEQGAAASSS